MMWKQEGLPTDKPQNKCPKMLSSRALRCLGACAQLPTWKEGTSKDLASRALSRPPFPVLLVAAASATSTFLLRPPFPGVTS